MEQTIKRTRRYDVEYVRNGFFLGGFKKTKIINILNERADAGWELDGITTHSSIFLLFFRRTSIVMTFHKDF